MTGRWLAVSTCLTGFLLQGCGNTNTVNAPLTLQNVPVTNAYSPSVVVEWNQEVLRAVTAGAPRPTVVARALFIIHSAIYDTWSAYDSVAVGSVISAAQRRPVEQRSEAQMREAVCFAAFHSARILFPAWEQNTGGFTNLLIRQGFSPTASDNPISPAGFGKSVAEQVLASRADDGSNSANNFADVTSSTYPSLYQPANSADPTANNAVGGPNFSTGRWTPLRVPNGTVLDLNGFPFADPLQPSSFADQRYLTPHWGAVRTFAVTDVAALRPVPPPQPGSSQAYTDGLGNTSTEDQAFVSQLDEIVNINRDLNDRQKSIAEYWADGPQSDTPPGHWNEFAQDLAFRDRHNLDQDAKLFFALNGGLLDSSICCWEAKRFYDYIRPVSAIQHRFFNQTILGWAGPGLGTRPILGRDWRPFQRLTFVTPAFAEYTSGHSTFSACGAQVLSRLTGRNQLFSNTVVLPWDRNRDGQGDLLGEFRVRPGSLTTEPGLPASEVVLRWDTLQDAANEAGMSRRFGGIHFQDGDLRGRQAGRIVGDAAVDRAQRLFNGQK